MVRDFIGYTPPISETDVYLSDKYCYRPLRTICDYDNFSTYLQASYITRFVNRRKITRAFDDDGRREWRLQLMICLPSDSSGIPGCSNSGNSRRFAAFRGPSVVGGQELAIRHKVSARLAVCEVQRCVRSEEISGLLLAFSGITFGLRSDGQSWSQIVGRPVRSVSLG